MGRRHTKTVVVVEVVDVLVAVRTARVPLIVVEGTAAQHTAFIGQPRRPKATGTLYDNLHYVIARRALVQPDEAISF